MHKGAIRERLYTLFREKGVSIAVNEDAGFADFCCLEFRFSSTVPATLHIGRFSDESREILLIAHEFGHLAYYETLSPADARTAYRTIVASNGMGIENITAEGKKMMLLLEMKASEYALTLLHEVFDEDAMEEAKRTYNRWLRGYHRKTGLPDGECPVL